MVAEDDSFRLLLRRVRAGEPEAVAELIRAYEPEIRRAVRVRLTDFRMRRLLDSMDVCQSVWANFFIHVNLGRFDLERPEELLKLLSVMARNKLRDHARRQHADRRDCRRVARSNDDALRALADCQPTPSRVLAGKDLLEQVRNRLPPEERHLAEQRALGRDWADLAAECGASPEALRKRLARALDRIVEDLGLEGMRRS